jgi:hypothetical protein
LPRILLKPKAVERSFQTVQDRLVKLMRAEGIRTLAAANAYLDNHYLPEWQRYSPSAGFGRRCASATGQTAWTGGYFMPGRTSGGC